MKKLLFLTVLCTLSSLYGMDNQRPKRSRDESSDQSIIPSKKVKITPFLYQIKHAIQNFNYEKVKTLLSSNQAKNLSKETLNILCKEAHNSKEKIKNMPNHEIQYNNAKNIYSLLDIFLYIANSNSRLLFTSFNEGIRKDPAIQIEVAIQKAITNNNPGAVRRLLLAPNAPKFSDEARKDLYISAERNLGFLKIHYENEGITIDSLGSQYDDINPEIKQTKQNAKEIIVLLGAFYHLKDHTFPKALFTLRPFSKIAKECPTIDYALEYLIRNEKEKVSICCFHFTLFNVARALVKQNGISVELITDQKQGDKKVTRDAIKHLIDHNIPVLAPKTDKWETNHHKFILFQKNINGKSLIWIGSYNLTGNANKEWNDVTILDDPKIINKYKDRFQEIKKASTPIKKDEIQEKIKQSKVSKYSYLKYLKKWVFNKLGKLLHFNVVVL